LFYYLLVYKIITKLVFIIGKRTMKTTDFSSNSPGKVIKSLKGYFVYIPNPLPHEFEWSNQLLTRLASAERSIARLEEVGQSFPVPHVLARPFVQKEAVLSSQIEGTHTTFQNLLRYEAQQFSFVKEKQDVHEVQNYIKALDYGLERIQTLPVSMRLIREMHEILMKGVRGELFTSGEVRRSQNWIGRPGATLEKARYVPPPVDEMHVCLGELEKYIHSESELPALIRVGLIHYQFEAIHPFLDGNGRMGRLLITLLLTTWQILTQPLLYLSLFFEKNKTEYYDRLLAVSQKGEWEEWLLFFLDGVHEQAEDAIEKIKSLQKLREQYQEQLSKDRSRKRLLKMVDYLISTPISSVSQAEQATDLGNYSVINGYFEKLSKYGIIEEITGKERNRVYTANAILKILEE
jgi:Fic family protein